MKKVPYDLRGMQACDFADMFEMGYSSVSSWKKEGEMPYWAYVVLDTTEIDKRDAEIARLNAEIARLNIIVDECFNRLAR